MHNQASESRGEDDSDAEVAEDPEPSRDIVHNSTPQQTALRRSSAARTKGGNIATAADSQSHETTAARGLMTKERAVTGGRTMAHGQGAVHPDGDSSGLASKACEQSTVPTVLSGEGQKT